MILQPAQIVKALEKDSFLLRLPVMQDSTDESTGNYIYIPYDILPTEAPVVCNFTY